MLDKEKHLAQSLKLLRFALEQKGISTQEFKILRKGMPYDGHEITCLQEMENGAWRVFGVVRGSATRKAQFENYRDAIDFFYVRLVQAETPWDYRTIWEAKTGESF